MSAPAAVQPFGVPLAAPVTDIPGVPAPPAAVPAPFAPVEAPAASVFGAAPIAAPVFGAAPIAAPVFGGSGPAPLPEIPPVPVAEDATAEREAQVVVDLRAIRAYLNLPKEERGSLNNKNDASSEFLLSLGQIFIPRKIWTGVLAGLAPLLEQDDGFSAIDAITAGATVTAGALRTGWGSQLEFVKNSWELGKEMIADPKNAFELLRNEVSETFDVGQGAFYRFLREFTEGEGLDCESPRLSMSAANICRNFEPQLERMKGDAGDIWQDIKYSFGNATDDCNAFSVTCIGGKVMDQFYKGVEERWVTQGEEGVSSYEDCLNGPEVKGIISKRFDCQYRTLRSVVVGLPQKYDRLVTFGIPAVTSVVAGQYIAALASDNRTQSEFQSIVFKDPSYGIVQSVRKIACTIIPSVQLPIEDQFNTVSWLLYQLLPQPAGEEYIRNKAYPGETALRTFTGANDACASFQRMVTPQGGVVFKPAEIPATVV